MTISGTDYKPNIDKIVKRADFFIEEVRAEKMRAG